MQLDRDSHFMEMAVAEARLAEAAGEVPVGAIVVAGGEVVGRGHNLREANHDPTAHAEIVAIREAARRLGSWRLEGAEIFVTLEPCPMCAYAIVAARFHRLIYGAEDLKAGAAGSLYDIVRDQRLNHLVEVTSGVLQEASSTLLKTFFKRRRQRFEGSLKI